VAFGLDKNEFCVNLKLKCKAVNLKKVFLKERHSSTKFERIFNYSVCFLISFLGLLVLFDVFNMEKNIRNIFGWAVLFYGILRFVLFRMRYKGEETKLNNFKKFLT